VGLEMTLEGAQSRIWCSKIVAKVCFVADYNEILIGRERQEVFCVCLRGKWINIY